MYLFFVTLSLPILHLHPQLRFLRARKFNVKKAFALICGDIEWRADPQRADLRSLRAAEVLGCNTRDMYAFFPTWMQGTDKQGRPVSYRQFGKFEISKVLKLTSMERLVRFHGTLHCC